MSINGIGVGGHPAWYETKKAQSGTKSDFGSKVTEVSESKNIVNIDPDAIFSIHHVKTGESANVYRAKEYSANNPVYLVKGIDENGNKYEETVDVSKVNPSNCSYTEMLALNAHTGDKSDSNFMTMSILKDKADNASYHEKADWIAVAHELMKDMKKAGRWESFLRYDKWMDEILAQKYQQEKTLDFRQKAEAGREAAQAPAGRIDYAEQAFETVGPNAPESVKKAWMEAAREVGANGLGVKSNGMLGHISQMMVQRLTNQMQGRPDPNDILGSSVSSAIAAVRKAIYDMDNPLRPKTAQSMEVQRLKMQERQFYQTFLNKLQCLG